MADAYNRLSVCQVDQSRRSEDVPALIACALLTTLISRCNSRRDPNFKSWAQWTTSATRSRDCCGDSKWLGRELPRCFIRTTSVSSQTGHIQLPADSRLAVSETSVFVFLDSSSPTTGLSTPRRTATNVSSRCPTRRRLYLLRLLRVWVHYSVHSRRPQVSHKAKTVSCYSYLWIQTLIPISCRFEPQHRSTCECFYALQATCSLCESYRKPQLTFEDADQVCSGSMEAASRLVRTQCESSIPCMGCDCDADCICRPGYNGSAIVQRSLDLNEPVIFVALNYR